MFRRNVPASRFFSKRGSRCPGSQSQGANTPSFWLFGSWSNVETQSIPQFAKKNFHLSVSIWFLVSSMSELATGPVDMHWTTDLQAYVQSPLPGYRSFFALFVTWLCHPPKFFALFVTQFAKKKSCSFFSQAKTSLKEKWEHADKCTEVENCIKLHFTSQTSAHSGKRLLISPLTWV